MFHYFLVCVVLVQLFLLRFVLWLAVRHHLMNRATAVFSQLYTLLATALATVLYQLA